MKLSGNNFYSTTPCDLCGGPTLDFASGSIWCPSEACTPGGHFVRRVAFERAPKTMDELRLKASSAKVTNRIPKVPVKVVVTPSNEFGGGMDDFVSSDDDR